MAQITYDVQTAGLGKKYGSFWALQDCTIDLPAGSITALVGPNGAGKSTLLKLLTNLSAPSGGSSTVLGSQPAQTTEFLAQVGYLAQEVPLYQGFTPQDYMSFGRHTNVVWDEGLYVDRLRALSIPFDKPVGKLSGGQRAQVALALALAKKPRVLLLDEPVAALDPLARRDFLQTLSQAVVDTNLTVVMSSHLLADLELICDRVLILGGGRVLLSDDVEHVLETHRLLVGARSQADQANAAYTVIQEVHTARQSTLLVRVDDAAVLRRTKWDIQEVTIEDVVLAYMGQSLHPAKQPKTGGVQ